MFKKFLIINLFLKLISVGYSIVSNEDYCNKDIFCKLASGPHIKCNNTGEFSNNCPENVELIELNEIVRKKIVSYHNQYRNMIASGKLNEFKTAERMAKMSWCPELAELAELNVKTCEFKHDDCRNTKEFPFSGQNLGTWISYGDMNAKYTPLKYLTTTIDDWFAEYKLANLNQINKFELTKNPIGHFTVMAAERNNCIGCAMIKYKKGSMYYLNIACNYAWNNIFKFPIYKSGKIGSKCKTGTDTVYSGLCSSKEIYSQDPLED